MERHCAIRFAMQVVQGALDFFLRGLLSNSLGWSSGVPAVRVTVRNGSWVSNLIATDEVGSYLLHSNTLAIHSQVFWRRFRDGRLTRGPATSRSSRKSRGLREQLSPAGKSKLVSSTGSPTFLRTWVLYLESEREQ